MMEPAGLAFLKKKVLLSTGSPREEWDSDFRTDLPWNTRCNETMLQYYPFVNKSLLTEELVH